MSRPRDIGTRVESAIVKACHAAGFPYADRQPLRGNRDQGDIILCPGVIIEAKGGKAAETASDNQILKWLDDLDKAQKVADADKAFLVTKRPGVGHVNAARWWAHTWLYQGDYRAPIRLTLGDALMFLKREGW